MIHAIVSGNIGRDPELAQAGSTPVLRFSLASNARAKVGGEWKNVPTWVNVSLFRRAESMAKILEKGRYVTVRGELTLRDYTGRDGSARQSLDLNADAVELGPKRDAQPSAAQHHDHGPDESFPDDDDIPF